MKFAIYLTHTSIQVLKNKFTWFSVDYSNIQTKRLVTGQIECNLSRESAIAQLE
jgi:hypothetical protein